MKPTNKNLCLKTRVLKYIISISLYYGLISTLGVTADIYKQKKESDAMEQALVEALAHEGHQRTVIRFVYNENSTHGPFHWSDIKLVRNGINARNHCPTLWTTPTDIRTQSVLSADVDVDVNSPDYYPSIEFTIPQDGIEKLEWEFGYPNDAYHGVEVRPPHLTTFQIRDRLESSATFRNTAFDFAFAGIFYCDPSKAAENRSMHRIDGKRFPLEIEFMFFSQPREIGIDKTLQNGAKVIMLSVLGKFADKDNKNLDPLIEVAAKYDGPSYRKSETDKQYTLRIKKRWSPTWLIPEFSSYYYYDDGSFPTPPCYNVDRVYVAKTPITISKRQLEVLTSIRSKREPNGVLECTYSVLQNVVYPGEVYYNSHEWRFRGDDKRPRTSQEWQKKKKSLKEIEKL